MGNNQGHNNQQGTLEQCLLTEQEFKQLRVGDKIDHRDLEGRYCAANIVWKSGTSVTVNYVGWSSKWDKTVNYKARSTNFAKYGSVSTRQAFGPLSQCRVGDYIQFRVAPNDPACKWKKALICVVDENSGQVKVQYKNSQGKTIKRFTHLDNQYEVRPISTNRNNNNNNGHRQNSQQRHSHSHNHNHDHNLPQNNYNNNFNQQSYQQEQVQRQDQMTVRTQLLLDDTQQQCGMIKDYLGGIASGKCSKDEIKQFNQKVVCGLTLFDMKVNGMRANEKSESISFNDAFKSAAMIIKKFENDCTAQFGHNQFLMQRLEPCLNYMRAVLHGHKVPPLPYVKDYEFNQNIASNVLSGVAHAQNHVMPERMAEISRNNDQYKSNQQQLKKEYESGGYNDKVHDVDFSNLIQDYNTKEIAFPKSKQEQDRIIEKEQNEYRFQQPNLLDGDGDVDM